MTLLDLLQTDGFELKRKASTGGGEYAGACPFCGYIWDTFRVWPESGRYWCRSCGKSGDAIKYLREIKNLSYQEACHKLGIMAALRRYGRKPSRPLKPIFEPKEEKTPAELWQAKARNFLDGAIDCLWSKQGESIRAWLNAEKGLNEATIKWACLGLNLADIYAPRQSWGLDPIIKDDGTERRQWIPAGLVIPLIKNNKVIRLRIRRNNPGDGPRYVIISGSESAPLVIGQNKGVIVIVESELDALLLSQEAGDLAGVVALGSVQVKPDIKTHELLKAAPVILNCLDTDDAGAKASWKFWPETYGGKVKRWPCINGKDASEARLNGLDLRAWIIAGIFGTEKRLERFCIQTIDGGLSDSEALKSMGEI